MKVAVDPDLDPQAYLGHAINLFRAAERQLGFPNAMGAIYLLLGFVVELALKAFLIHRKFSERQLFRLGHDLIALLEEAQRQGLTVNPPSIPMVVEFLSEPHRTHQFRYPRAAAVPLFEPSAELLEIFAGLIDSIALELGSP